MPFGPTISVDLGFHQLVHDPQPDTDAQREQSLACGADELAERFLNLRRQRTLHRLGRRDDLRSGYLLHGGSSCPRGLGLVAPNAPNRSGRGGRDRRSKFYELSDNLLVVTVPVAAQRRELCCDRRERLDASTGVLDDLCGDDLGRRER